MWGSTRVIQCYSVIQAKPPWSTLEQLHREKTERKTPQNDIEPQLWLTFSSLIFPVATVGATVALQLGSSWLPLGTPGALQSSPQKVHLIMRCKPWGIWLKSSVGQHVTCDNKIYQNRPKNWDRIGPMVLKRLACRGGMQCDNLSLLLILVDDTYFALESMFGMWTVWICQFLSVRLLFQDPTHPWEPEMHNILQTSHYRLRLNKGHGPTLEPYCGT